MTYRTRIVRRWSRRDRLGVLVIALMIAFVTGAVVVLLAAGTQATAIAAQFDTGGTVTSYDTERVAREEAAADAVVVPVTRATTANGSATVVGVPRNADVDAIGGRALRVATGTTRATIAPPREVRLVGPDAATTVTVRSRRGDASVFAPSWYVTDAPTVRRLGPTGALVVEPGSVVGASGPAGAAGDTASLVGALAFFVVGLRETVDAFAVVTGGTALLIGVTVYSVLRMSVRDRRETIRIVRATGGPPRTVLGLFAARALLLTGVGVGLGYAIGTIAVNAAVNAAVVAGVPTTLSTPVTRRAVRILLPAYAVTVCLGGLAGALAAWPAVRIPPARLTDPIAGSGPGDRVRVEWLRPTLLGWQTVVPTTATLVAFVAVAVVVGGAAGAIGPVVASDGATITEPGSTHPVQSTVPVAYADALRDRGIAASPEILLFERLGRHPVLVRGGRFDGFAAVTDARLVTGRSPAGPSEAVIGRDLARTLDVARGERVTLGGSTRAAITRVRVVGVFVAPGAHDDQLLVPLETARHMADVEPGTVQFVRAARLPTTAAGPATPDATGTARHGDAVTGVIALDVPETVAANATLTVGVNVRNDALERRRTTVHVHYRGRTRPVTLAIPATANRTARVRFPSGPPGTGRVRAGTVTATVEVRPGHALRLGGLPARVPPGSEPLVRVTNATGAPVANATVTVGSRTRWTDDDGRVRLPPAAAGRRTVRIRAGSRTTTAAVRVTDQARVAPAVTLRVTPDVPGVLTRPEARVRLSNPWNRTLRSAVRVTGPGVDRSVRVRLPPGGDRRVRAQLARRPAGTYTVSVAVNGTQAATATYEVSGDERLAAAVATSGREGSSGIGQGIDLAFGNLRTLVAVMLLLAGLMTVGGTSVVFARAVHARRRTIGLHRATGALPRAIAGLVLRDAVRIGLSATVAAVALGQLGTVLLSRLGYLTVFGARLPPTLGPVATLGVVAAGTAIAVVGAGVATLGLLVTPPARLLSNASSAESPDSGLPSRHDD